MTTESLVKRAGLTDAERGHLDFLAERRCLVNDDYNKYLDLLNPNICSGCHFLVRHIWEAVNLVAGGGRWLCGQYSRSANPQSPTCGFKLPSKRLMDYYEREIALATAREARTRRNDDID